MCGRFGRFGLDTPEALAEWHDVLSYIKEGWKAEAYNVKPTTSQPFIREVEGERRLELGTWAWRRAFSKAPLINARGEEAAGKRTWVVALRERRCVVPASFFYEWHPDTKQPYCFALESRAGFGIGGIWEETAEGAAFVLLTTQPNSLCSPVHDRMPLILRREDEEAWTDPATPFDRVQDLIKPYEPSLMTAWPVSKAVSKIHSEGPELIAPVALGGQQQAR